MNKTKLIAILIVLQLPLFSQQEKVGKYFNDDFVIETKNNLSIGYLPFREGLCISYERVFWHVFGVEAGIGTVNTAKLNSFTDSSGDAIYLSEETLQKKTLNNFWFEPKIYISENFHLGFLSTFFLDIPEKPMEFAACAGYKYQIISHLFVDLEVGIGRRYSTKMTYINSSEYYEEQKGMFTYPVTLKIGYDF